MVFALFYAVMPFIFVVLSVISMRILLVRVLGNIA